MRFAIPLSFVLQCTLLAVTRCEAARTEEEESRRSWKEWAQQSVKGAARKGHRWAAGPFPWSPQYNKDMLTFAALHASR